MEEKRMRSNRWSKEHHTGIGLERLQQMQPLSLFLRSSLLKIFFLPPKCQHPTLGSPWNQAGTWEEKNLNKWASDRIKELLASVGSLEFSSGKAEIAEVSKCFGDAFLVTVRNKKRVGYTYELTLKIKGEWIINEARKMVKGHIDIPEFSFGELDDLQVQVELSDDKNFLQPDKMQISQDLKLFLQPIREKLLQFEQELKER